MKNQKGFTLVELLIVIALLGALVIGLLAAIDPIEQIRRGRDTGLRDVASQFYNAEQRYYTNRGAFTSGVNNTVKNVGDLTDDITALIDAGELKSQFTSQLPTTASKLVVKGDIATPTSIMVCYEPESKAFSTDANNSYNSSLAGDQTPAAGMLTCIQ